jgi:chaperone modulatory protein CbpM
MSEEKMIESQAIDLPDLSLEEVATLAHCDLAWLRERLQEGLLAPGAVGAAEWRLSVTSIARVRRMRQCEQDFEASPELAALVADLLDELDALRARLRRAGID